MLHKIKRLGIIAGGYPSPAMPANKPFIRQFANAVARIGVESTVIAPISFRLAKDREGYPYYSEEPAGEGKCVHVYRPVYPEYWDRGHFAWLGWLNPQRSTLRAFTNVVLQTIRKENLKLDVLYGHFFYKSGVAAIRAGNALGIPGFPGLGESVKAGGKIWSILGYGYPHAKRELRQATRVIVNSSLLAKLVHRDLDFPRDNIGVFPNGIDRNIFNPTDKVKAREELGFPQGRFIVSCVGAFGHRKGQARLFDAVAPLDDVSVAFVGRGIPYPIDNKVIYNSIVKQDKVSVLLSASDLFVLPTLGEGSCNSIIEAMACGLPVVSSSGEFNDDILDDSCCVRVDPMNVEQIRNAIIQIKKDPANCRNLSDAAVNWSRRFDADQRAISILEFMENT